MAGAEAGVSSTKDAIGSVDVLQITKQNGLECLKAWVEERKGDFPHPKSGMGKSDLNAQEGQAFIFSSSRQLTHQGHKNHCPRRAAHGLSGTRCPTGETFCASSVPAAGSHSRQTPGPKLYAGQPRLWGWSSCSPERSAASSAKPSPKGGAGSVGT